ncbi:MAG: electron transfer flavoprotein subunit alpha [Verrucomicrobiae bacterium]|nr:electron transfer flavoprotein subunit alpha [Verrucomicrobiae bacterium]
METILALLFVEADGSLGKAARETLGAARQLSEALGGAAWVAGLAGETTAAGAAQLGGCGAGRVLQVSGAELAQARYATDAAAAEALARQAGATVILAPASSRVNRILPGVAHRLKGRVDTHITGLSVAEGQLTATRWFYRQRMEAALRRTQRPWCLALESGCFPALETAGPAPAVETVALPAGLGSRSRVTGYAAPAADAQTIRPDAELLFVAGAGWTKKQADGQAHVAEAERLILEFLRLSRASLGSSKSLVDLSGEGQAVLSFLTHLNQIGQTGATPRHPKGLATCCHGEEPHTVGWRFITERRAVNLDPNCGWARGKADVLYVADAFAVMRKVNELLAAGAPG